MDRESLLLLADILEAIMIVSFGLSWPLNVYKSLKSKSTKGKSLPFLFLIDFGYVAGITSKLINPNFDWSTRWWIFAFYIFNFVMVTFDLILYFIHLSKEKKEAKEKLDEKSN